MAQRRRGSYPPEFCAEAVRLASTTTTPLTTYLAVGFDLYARRVVGWAVADTLATRLVC